MTVKQSTIDAIQREVWGDKLDSGEPITGPGTPGTRGPAPVGMLRPFAKKLGFDVPKRPRSLRPAFAGSVERDDEVTAALATIRHAIGWSATNAKIIRSSLLAYAESLRTNNTNNEGNQT